MKLVIFIFALLFSLLIIDNQAWAAPITDTHNKNLLREIRNIAQHCAVSAQAAEGAAKIYKSQCAIFTLDTADTAHIFVGGEWLTARLAPSEDSDGGDLAHLIIEDHNGRLIARKENVLAFGQILNALSTNFAYDSSN